MRMPRLVRDLSTKLGKDVDLQIMGADTEIDRSVVDALSDPLVHMVRNALDHGLETPAVRRAAGKDETATLRITAGHSGGNVMITVEDDGAGVNFDVVRKRAVERGLISAEQAAALDDEGVIELLFLPGFSTAETTTEISGRGVGMDAVRNMTRELGGDISMVSKLGQGTIARLAIPLTLAVMTVLVVDVDGIRLALPIDRVERTVRLSDHSVTESGALRLMAVDDGTYECIDLGGYVGYGDTREPRYGVIVQGRSGRKVLSVSNLIGEYETVTRPLPRVSGDRMVFMGGSVQSDGTVVLIVNVDGIFEGDVGRSGGYNQFALI
ncbi:MAG: chemotaxis protein CheW [Thermoleophilia bacterium]|nr:chemotaxis protein CheW [Thermoleophilia bacterium]